MGAYTSFCQGGKENLKWKELPRYPSGGEQPAWSWGGTCKCGPSVCLPLQRLQNSALSLAHTPSLEGFSLVSRSHTCLRVCASNVRTPVRRAATFPRGALGLSFPPSFCPLSFPLFPSSSTPLCCFPCPSSSSPPFFSHNFSFLLCPACSDCGWCASRERAEGDAADATAVWAPCLLLGPLRRTRLHVSWGV